VSRRAYVLTAAVSLAVAATLAIVLIVLLRNGGEAKLTRAEYIARVEAVCRDYNRRLARIPAPVAVGNPQAVAETIDRALPLVEERAATAKAIAPPPELAARVEQVFSRSDRAIAELRSARAAAHAGSLERSARALGRFLAASDDARRAAVAIGLNC
jgi:DNA-binding PucR family transcriptional regulator